MPTVNNTLNDKWLQISNDTPCIVTGNEEIYYCWSTIRPAETLRGHFLPLGVTLVSNVDNEKLWAKALKLEVNITVSTEL